MSIDTGRARQRPNLWSYISFSSGNNQRRKPSMSLPLSEQMEDDHYEKPTYDGRQRRGTSPVDSYPTRWQTQRPKLVKYAAIAAAVIFILWLIGPSSRIQNYNSNKAASDTPIEAQIEVPVEALAPPPAVPQAAMPVVPPPAEPAAEPAPEPAAKQAAKPVKPLGTTKCTEPFSPEKPLVQYALMIDAGSTGSRIHVYKFNNCGSTPELEDEIFKMTPKKANGSGLSSYDADAEGAAKSLDMLMEVAMSGVPDEDKPCTPIAVKATAGLRKLGEAKSKKILEAVRHRLETVYPFALVDDKHHGVEVMEGTDEGVYAWITTNYLLGKIGNADNTPTAAVFDLGGGSTQIVFQPTFPKAGGGMPTKMEEGDHKYDLQFGGRKFSLYQHSYLGYGLMEARNALHMAVLNRAYETSVRTDMSIIVNPCIIPGTQKSVTLDLPPGHPLDLGPKHLARTLKISATMKGPESGAAERCLAWTDKILKKDADCKVKPCAFNGVHQPSLAQTFANEDIYLFSYFYDRIFPLGLGETFTIKQLRDLVESVCAGESGWGRFKSISGALDELRGRPESCLDLSFMFSLLHKGYEMSLERKVNIAKKIKGNELGWCLGASLPLLSKESGWTCKIEQVA